LSAVLIAEMKYMMALTKRRPSVALIGVHMPPPTLLCCPNRSESPGLGWFSCGVWRILVERKEASLAGNRSVGSNLSFQDKRAPVDANVAEWELHRT
jgi:hypothetical protein